MTLSRQITQTVLAAVIAICTTSTIAAAPQAPARARRSPPMVKHQVIKDGVDYRVRIVPGVPEPGKTVTVKLALTTVLEDHDVTYGKRAPIESGNFTAVLVGPKSKKFRRGYIDARQALPMRDKGSYAFTFTSPVQGVHALYISGTTADGKQLSYTVPVAYGVWPVAKDVKLPRKPNRVRTATTGDSVHGKALCVEYCKKDLAFALPNGKTPTYLDSAAVAGLSDQALIETLVGERAVYSLSATQRNDLAVHLRTLFVGVRDFFSEASVIMPAEFTINEYGRKRLSESYSKLKNLGDAQASGKVFVVYKGTGANPALQRVDHDDRVGRDTLDRSRKLGYIIFRSHPTDPNMHEVGFALGLEPTYPIIAVKSRSKTNKAGKLAKLLRSFRGQGRFNDPGSLRRGAKALRSKLLPLYLTAAELATMYYADEREFTAFDAELDAVDE